MAPRPVPPHMIEAPSTAIGIPEARGGSTADPGCAKSHAHDIAVVIADAVTEIERLRSENELLERSLRSLVDSKKADRPGLMALAWVNAEIVLGYLPATSHCVPSD